jgi:hypothetical protein
MSQQALWIMSRLHGYEIAATNESSDFHYGALHQFLLKTLDSYLGGSLDAPHVAKTSGGSSRCRSGSCFFSKLLGCQPSVQEHNPRRMYSNAWCREGESNPHAPFGASDFKSDTSASSVIPAHRYSSL